MSLIKPILERRHRHRRSAASDGSNSAIGASTAGDELRTSSLGCHATWYRENLGQCNEPMLQYEWAWLNGRIDALEHVQADGKGAFREMLAETQLFRTLLLREFAARGMSPSPPKANVIPSEEAWEITSLRVKEEWGIL
jgi:hypothetical protein